MTHSEGLPETGRDFEFNPEPEIFYEDVGQGNFELWRKLQLQLNTLKRELEDIHLTAGEVALAYQEITITAADLATTIVANDTLKTVSQNDIEFDWMDPRLKECRSVNLEPALGVEPAAFLMDTSAHINPAVLHAVADDGTVSHNLQMDCCTPVPAQPTYLQRRQWSNDGGVWDLRAKAWEVGQVLHLAQLRVIEATAL